VEYFGASETEGLFKQWRDVFATQRNALIALDGHVGDSDLGITMNKGFEAAYGAVQANNGQPIGKLFQMAGLAFAKAAPSTMGTLVATGLMRGGKSILESEKMGVPELRSFWQAFHDGIAERGKAKPGDKTVLDVLGPLAKSLQDCPDDVTLAAALQKANQAAADGLEATMSMIAQHGKAAVFPDKSIGLQDAGATVGFLIIQGMHNYSEASA
jgi:dihydroxyacetone kinase-like protein